MHITSALTKYPQLASLRQPGKPGPAQAKPVLSTAKGDPATPVTPTKTKMVPSKPPLTDIAKLPGVTGKAKVPHGDEPAAFVKSKPTFTGSPATLDHPPELHSEHSSPPSRIDQLLTSQELTPITGIVPGGGTDQHTGPQSRCRRSSHRTSRADYRSQSCR